VHVQCVGDQIHLLALYTRLSLLLKTLFSGWLHCRNARSIVKIIDFEVSDVLTFKHMACGRGLSAAIGPVARKPLLGGFVAQ
jgi:hypothetical protein